MSMPNGLWKVDRAYNSRTLHDGLFGFGWCTDWESTLKFYGAGNLMRTVCGGGTEEVFTKVDSPDSSPVVYRNERVGEFVFAGDHYTGHFLQQQCESCGPMADEEDYDLRGRLMRSRFGPLTVDYRYRDLLLREAHLSTGLQVLFDYYSNGKIRKISCSDGTTAAYWYSWAGDLVKVKWPSGEDVSYEYDELHNLTKATLPDGTYEEMAYNNQMDWIVAFREWNGCRHTYSYEMSRDTPKDHFWSEMLTICPQSEGTWRVDREQNEYRFSPLHLLSRARAFDYDTWDLSYGPGSSVTKIENGIRWQSQTDHRTSKQITTSVTALSGSAPLERSLSPRERQLEILKSATGGPPIEEVKTPAQVLEILKSTTVRPTIDQVKTAVVEAESLSQSRDEKTEALLLGAVACEGLEEYDAAKDMYKRLLNLDADNVAALAGLARNLVLRDGNTNTEEARGYANQALKKGPQNASAWESMGLVLMKSGDSEQAESDLARASSLQPGLPRLHWELGNLYEMEKKQSLARDQWNAAAKILDGDVRSQEETGLLATLRGKLSAPPD